MAGVAAIPASTTANAQEYEALGVEIANTNNPLTGGEVLEVEVAVTNHFEYSMEETVGLVGPMGHVLDRERVGIAPESKGTTTLGVQTPKLYHDLEYPVCAMGKVSVDVTVITVKKAKKQPKIKKPTKDKDKKKEPELSVKIVQTSAPVKGGEYLKVTVDVKNVGGGTAQETLSLYDSSNDLLDRHDVRVNAGETERVRMGFDTYPVRNDSTFPLTVACHQSSDTEEVTVYGTG
ncbi:hypothetical protein ACYJ1Y_03485 [Natrialbaceae archaeon A-gly3]